MMKILLATASAAALFVLAACDSGETPPPDGGAGMNQTEPTDTAPAAPDPVQ